MATDNPGHTIEPVGAQNLIPAVEVQPPPPEAPPGQGVEEDHATWAVGLDKQHAQVEAAVRRAREADRKKLAETERRLTGRITQLREMCGHNRANAWRSTGHALLLVVLGAVIPYASGHVSTLRSPAIVVGGLLLLAIVALLIGQNFGAKRANEILGELDHRPEES